MRESLCAAVGALLGNSMSMPGRSGEGPKVYLNGGQFTTSTVGVIYGYVDDMDGCKIHAAGMNYYYRSDEATREKMLKAPGHSFCSLDAIR